MPPVKSLLSRERPHCYPARRGALYPLIRRGFSKGPERGHWGNWHTVQKAHFPWTLSVLCLVFLKKQTKISHQFGQDKDSPPSSLSKVSLTLFGLYPTHQVCRQFKAWAWHRTRLLSSLWSHRRAGHPAISSDTLEGLKRGKHNND